MNHRKLNLPLHSVVISWINKVKKHWKSTRNTSIIGRPKIPAENPLHDPKSCRANGSRINNKIGWKTMRKKQEAQNHVERPRNPVTTPGARPQRRPAPPFCARHLLRHLLRQLLFLRLLLLRGLRARRFAFRGGFLQGPDGQNATVLLLNPVPCLQSVADQPAKRFALFLRAPAPPSTVFRHLTFFAFFSRKKKLYVRAVVWSCVRRSVDVSSCDIDASSEWPADAVSQFRTFVGCEFANRSNRSNSGSSSSCWSSERPPNGQCNSSQLKQ